MRQRDLEHRLRRLAWPAPPPALRARVLREAPVYAAPIEWSDRVWFSRTWRLSMAAAVLAVVAVDQLGGTQAGTTSAALPRTLAEVQVVDETARQLGLPSDTAATLVRRPVTRAWPREIDLGYWPTLPALDAEGARR